jgi:catechol 2,3-dioxygenase-like lactoylglutathione lyase family enzyme
MGVTGVTVISVPVSDQDRALAFYRDALGFVVLDDTQWNPAMRWLHLGVPGAGFTITLVTWFEKMPAGSMYGLVLEVDDIDAVATDLHARGFLASADVESQPWGRFVVIADPDGNSIILQHSSRD